MCYTSDTLTLIVTWDFNDEILKKIEGSMKIINFKSEMHACTIILLCNGVRDIIYYHFHA